jgi:hypothetical protein
MAPTRMDCTVCTKKALLQDGFLPWIMRRELAGSWLCSAWLRDMSMHPFVHATPALGVGRRIFLTGPAIFNSEWKPTDTLHGLVLDEVGNVPPNWHLIRVTHIPSVIPFVDSSLRLLTTPRRAVTELRQTEGTRCSMDDLIEMRWKELDADVQVV